MVNTCIRAIQESKLPKMVDKRLLTTQESNPRMVNKHIRAIRDETSARLVREKYQPDVPVAGLLVGGVGATSGLRLWMCRVRVRYAWLSRP